VSSADNDRLTPDDLELLAALDRAERMLPELKPSGLLALRGVAEEIAKGVGRLRRQLGSDNYAVERLAASAATLDALVRPTAGELVRRAGLSVEDALDLTDEAARAFDARAGEEQRWL
jgi:hypothetical protein